MNSYDDNLSARSLRRDGPLVDVELHFDCYDDSVCPPVRGKGMIDTGADRTAIDIAGLDYAKPNGTFHAQGVTSESVELPTYPMQMRFPGSDLPGVELEQVAGTPHLRAQGLVALIGRDVLEQSKLTYDGPSGEFSLASDVQQMTVKSPAVAWGVMALLGAMAAVTTWAILRKPECPPCLVTMPDLKK